MPIIACPNCQGKLRFPEDTPPRRVKCPTCGHVFLSSAGADPKAPVAAGTPGSREPRSDFEYDDRRDDDRGAGRTIPTAAAAAGRRAITTTAAGGATTMTTGTVAPAAGMRATTTTGGPAAAMTTTAAAGPTRGRLTASSTERVWRACSALSAGGYWSADSA